MLTPNDTAWVCEKCGWTLERDASEETKAETKQRTPQTELETLPTTESGTVRKRRALKWLDGRECPTDEELLETIVPKPSEHSGSTYSTPISNIRLTGDPEFIETVAGLFKPLLEFENDETLLKINLQQVEEKESGDLTDNYALYLSVAERSR